MIFRIVSYRNLPYIDWVSNAARNDGVHNLLLDCFLNLGLSQFVVEPTRLNQSGSGNILDIIMCNDPLFVNISTVKPPLCDHCIIDFLLYDVQPDQAETELPSSLNNSAYGTHSSKITVPVYNWSAGNYDAINDCLSTIDWHKLFGFNFDADSIWSGFKELLWPIISLHVPKKMIPHNLKYRPRQYPKKIRVLLCRKAAIWRQLRTTKSQKLKSLYSRIAHECKVEILNFDVCRENKILEANNLGAFYRFVNNKLSAKTGIAPLFNPVGNLISSDCDKANLLNDYFHSVFTKDNGNLPVFPMRLRDPSPSKCDIAISPDIILKILSKLKVNSAAGPDGLPPMLYRETKKALIFPLSIMFRSFIDMHNIPSEWKLSIITPIFKKGSPSDPANYRPVALTCTCSKILESIVVADLLQYLSK